MKHTVTDYGPLFVPSPAPIETVRPPNHPAFPDSSPRVADTFVREDDRPRLATQNAALLIALRAGHRLSTREAMDQLGVMRLAARMHDLRQAGYPVRSDWDSARKCQVYWLDGTNTGLKDATLKGHGEA